MILYSDFRTADANVHRFARAHCGVGWTHRQTGVRRRIDDVRNGVSHHDLAGYRGDLVSTHTDAGGTDGKREGVEDDVCAITQHGVSDHRVVDGVIGLVDDAGFGIGDGERSGFDDLTHDRIVCH